MNPKPSTSIHVSFAFFFGFDAKIKASSSGSTSGTKNLLSGPSSPFFSVRFVELYKFGSKTDAKFAPLTPGTASSLAEAVKLSLVSWSKSSFVSVLIVEKKHVFFFD